MNKNTNEPGAGDMSMIEHEKGAGVLKGWHLDKRITVSHLFTTLAFAVAIGGVLYAQDSRITNVEHVQDTHAITTTLEMNNQKVQFQLQLDAIKENDRAMMSAQLQHFNQILVRLAEQTRKLERIEDGVNRHIETSLKRDNE
jgi:hypothetical protein